MKLFSVKSRAKTSVTSKLETFTTLFLFLVSVSYQRDRNKENFCKVPIVFGVKKTN